MATLNLNTRVDFDKTYAWEALQNKFFAQSLDQVDPNTVVEITVQQLRELSNDSHECGRIRERSLHAKGFR